MLKTTRAILADAFRDLARSWRELAALDLAWRAAAFAALTPATLLLLRWVVAREGGGVCETQARLGLPGGGAEETHVRCSEARGTTPETGRVRA